MKHAEIAICVMLWTWTRDASFIKLCRLPHAPKPRIVAVLS
jgi:hypothetical protein